MNLLKYPNRYEHESLHSYLFRLARSNFADFHLLFDLVGNNYYVHNSFKISFIESNELVDHIAKLARLSKFEILQMTVQPYLFGLFIISKKPNQNYYFKRYIEINGSKFCPLCLEEANYERIFWKLKPIKICLNHRTMLFSNCPICRSAITSDMIVDGYCKCGSKLSSFEPKTISSSTIIENQKRFYKAIQVYNDIIVSHSILSNLSYTEFIKLYDFISFIAELGFIRFYNISDSNYAELYTDLRYIELIEKIIGDWPVTYFSLIDIINENDLNNNLDKNDDFNDQSYLIEKCNYFVKPIQFIQGIWNRVYNIKLLSDTMIAYFSNHYFKTLSYMTSSWGSNFHIKVKDASRLFRIDRRILNKNFWQSSTYREQNVDLLQLMGTLYMFVRLASKCTNDYNEGIDFNSAYRTISFDFNYENLLFRLVELAKHGKVNIMIDISKIGFEMIVFERDTISRCFDNGDFEPGLYRNLY